MDVTLPLPKALKVFSSNAPRVRFPVGMLLFALAVFAGHIALAQYGVLPTFRVVSPPDIVVMETNAAYAPTLGQPTTVGTSPLRLRFASSQGLSVDQGGTFTFIEPQLVSLGEVARVFFQSLFSREPFRVIAGPVLLSPSGSAVTVVREGKHVTVRALDGGTVVGFLKENIAIWNELFLPSGFQVTIAADRVGSHLAPLLPTKLLKEFPIIPITPDVWTTFATTHLEEARSRRIAAFTLAMSSRSLPSYPDSMWEMVRRGIVTVAQAMTVDPLRREKRHVAEIARARENAIISFAHGDRERGKAWQMTYAALFPSEVTEAFLEEELRALSLLTPTHPAYPLKTQFIRSIGRFALVHLLLDDVRRIITTDPPRALSTLESYSELLRDLVRETPRPLLTHERQAFYSLLAREFSLYRVPHFETLALLEDALATTVTSQEDLDELHQTFIQDNLRVLDRIKRAVAEKRVTIPDAVSLGNFLITRSQSLRPSGVLRAAVNTFYEEELRRAALFMTFLQESGVAALVGTDAFSERFARFQKEKETLLSLQQYLQAIGQVGTEGESFATLREKTKADFAEIGATIDVLEEDPSKPAIVLVKASALHGIRFSGSYDPNQKVLYDVTAQEHTVHTGIALRDLAFLLEHIGDVVAREEAPAGERHVAEETVSQFEAAVRELLLVRITNAGMTISPEHINVLDLDRNLFSIERATLSSGEVLSFSFTFQARENRVNDLVLHKETGDQAIAGTTSLEGLVQRMRKLR